MWLAGGDGLMPLVGASPIYRPPVAGEPLRLREDGHWSTDGLVGYWPMNEMVGTTVRDLSGRGNHGTFINGPTWAVQPDGHGCVALVRASSQYVQGASLRLSWPFTVVHPIFAVSGGIDRPLSADGTYGYIASGWHFQILFTGQLRMTCFDNIHSGSAAGGRTVTSTSRVDDNKWHTFAAVVRDATDMALYRDGVLIDTALSGEGDPIGYKAEAVLRAGWAVDRFLNTRCGGPLIYNRALSTDEIAALYADPDLPIWRPRRGISLALLGAEVVLLTVTDSVTVADSDAFTHCMTLADAVVLIDTDAFMHLLTIADAVGLAEDDTYRHDIAPADSVTLAEAIALLHRLGVADAVKLSPSVSFVIYTDREVTVTDALVCTDGLALAHTMTVQDLVLLRQLIRAITPCSGGYFENPSGFYQQSNLYQEMV